MGKKKHENGKKTVSKEESAAQEAPETSTAETSELEALRARAAERDEFLDLLQRTRAEFSNYRKRVERERARWSEGSVGEFVQKLLPLLDDIDRALAHAGESSDFDGFVEGIRLIENKIYDVLKSSGVEPFYPEGEPFNPAEHEAVIVEETDQLPDQTVSEVLLKGYRLRDRILRPAQVKVARNISPAPPEDAPAERDEEDADDADL